MDVACFELKWPADGLELCVYAHELARYSFHWHETEYEINVILSGKAEFCCEGNIHTLEADDVLVVNCTEGHCSLAMAPDTIALAVRFSADALKQYVSPGNRYQFKCVSGRENRDQQVFVKIRFLLAQIMEAQILGGRYAELTAKASMELLIATLCSGFQPEEVPITRPKDDGRQKSIRSIVRYIDRHYGQKITLDDLARISKYNKTYVSTFFKQNIGMNFYDYLTRVRFMKAMTDLDDTDKNLTEIAIDNGFPDLKTYNRRFMEMFHLYPSQYRLRAQHLPKRDSPVQRRYCGQDSGILRGKMEEYVSISARPPRSPR